MHKPPFPTQTPSETRRTRTSALDDTPRVRGALDNARAQPCHGKDGAWDAGQAFGVAGAKVR
jgi:hypothetical protein